VTSDPDAALMMLVRTIAAGDSTAALAMLDAQPELARIALTVKGATRQDAKAHFLDDIGHYVYQGDTALHIAAAGYRTDIVRRLIALGSDLGAKNRLGAEPLHLAAMGTPGAPRFNPLAQAATITCLIEAGSNPNAHDKQGVAPLHRAVRTRCAAAVQALLAGGANPTLANKSGSTPMKLAQMTTGRGGSGSPDAKAQQQEIVRLLREALA
jgi:ankyrin repeat protein